MVAHPDPRPPEPYSLCMVGCQSCGHTRRTARRRAAGRLRIVARFWAVHFCARCANSFTAGALVSADPPSRCAPQAFWHRATHSWGFGAIILAFWHSAGAGSFVNCGLLVSQACQNACELVVANVGFLRAMSARWCPLGMTKKVSPQRTQRYAEGKRASRRGRNFSAEGGQVSASLDKRDAAANHSIHQCALAHRLGRVLFFGLRGNGQSFELRQLEQGSQAARRNVRVVENQSF